MTDYDNRNTGVLFKNDKKTEDRHPDYTGSFYDGTGADYFCDAWIKRSQKSGNTFLSFRVKPKQAKQAPPSGSSLPLSDELNDEVPF